MKANRFTEEQIVKALREVETGGKKAIEQQRELGISNDLEAEVWRPRSQRGQAVKGTWAGKQ